MSEQNEKEIAATLERLSSPVLDRDSTELLVVKLLQLRNPDVKVNLDNESAIEFVYPNGGTSQMFLANMHVEITRSPEDRVAIVERFIRALGPRDSPEHFEIRNVVALVRDLTYQQFVRAEERETLTEHLVADIWILFAVDLPESTVTLSLERFVKTGLSKVELLRVAIDNTAQLLGDCEVEAYGELFTFSSSHGEYLSSLLLMDYVWEQVAAMVEGDIVAAVPARDTVIFTGTQNSEGVSELRMQADYVVKNGHHTISETLLRRTSDGWTVFS